MSKANPIEASEIFNILSDTINGANFDDLCDAAHRIVHIAGCHKQSEIARKIIDEVEILVNKHYNEYGYTILDFEQDIAELKKKYTEEQTDGN